MTDRVAECIYPERKSCRGCSQSYNPARYDGGCMLHYEGGGKGVTKRYTLGGCMLHYEGGGAKSLEALELETAAQPRTNYRKLDKGGYRAENP